MPNFYDEEVRLPVRKFLERIFALGSCISNIPVYPDHRRLYEDINWLALVGCLGHRHPLVSMGYAARHEQWRQNLGRVPMQPTGLAVCFHIAKCTSLRERRLSGDQFHGAIGSSWPILLKNSISVQRRFLSFMEMQPKI